MNAKTLQKLEYTKIISTLTEYASSKDGKKLCQELAPKTNLEEINESLTFTSDVFSRMIKKGRLNFSDVFPIHESIKRLEIGAILSSTELLRIESLLRVCARTKTYGRKDPGDETTDSLTTFFDQLEPLSFLSKEICSCIIGEDEFADDASPTLKKIRSEMNRINNSMHSTLNSLLNGSLRQYLQDPIITMRGDRYCLPVKAEHRSKVAGLIHDQSSTGSTLFIEPMSVVNKNNELKELYAKELEEIQVILAKLSESAAAYTDELSNNYFVLVQLDFIFAKGAYAFDTNSTKPVFNTNHIINLRNARHPLLDPKKVVPINVAIGKDYSLLIVTGPNTGGKTVSLKTVGLLTLMGQAGLFIPAGERSQLAVFKEVYADIGDEQSIEQSLSTFSSHMTNIVSFIEKADVDSLVLFDELGAGTDPTEGAALAIAILSYLHNLGVTTMATTHYSELKVYALSTDGVENASCEFDVQSLRPTYRLLIGIPGKSNAFAISSRLGMPDYIIDEAKTNLSTHQISFEDLLVKLENERKNIEESRLEIEQNKKEIEKLKNKTVELNQKLAKDRDRILNEAKEKANSILRETKELVDETVAKSLRYSTHGVSASEMEKDRQKLRDKIKETTTSSINVTKKNVSNKASDFTIGTRVKVLSMQLEGSISSLPDAKGFVFVQMGILRSSVHISDLEILPEEKIDYTTFSKKGQGLGRSMSIRPEINLLGKNVDDAIIELDKYLDDAMMAHLSSVRIVHGKGTGVLRTGIHNYLKRLSYVKSFKLAEHGEGDAGVTVVEFK